MAMSDTTNDRGDPIASRSMSSDAPSGSPAETAAAEISDSAMFLDALRVAMMWQLHPRTAYRLHTRITTGGSLDVLIDNLEMLEISPRTRAVLDKIPTRADAAALADRLAETGISFRMVGQPDFPRELEQIPDPPPYLFLKGNCWRGGRPGPAIGLIGSRAASRTGKEIARTLARDLALSGCTVVSGLARGIDSEAHRGALDADGCTIGVLGAGLDVIYPPEHEELHSRMLEEGGVISEFAPGAPPLRLHFPRRNRILAGLIDVLVVVEGREVSGARSTVDHALDQGREVMAVPRDPVVPGSALPNRLLFEGARPAISARDVIEAAGAGTAARSAPRSLHGSTSYWKKAHGDPGRSRSSGLPSVEQAGLRPASARSGDSAPAAFPTEEAGEIARAHALALDDAPLTQQALALLAHGPREVDSLIAELHVSPSLAQAALAELEVLGWIEREQGRYRRR
jgi:DNA processing protein